MLELELSKNVCISSTIHIYWINLFIFGIYIYTQTHMSARLLGRHFFLISDTWQGKVLKAETLKLNHYTISLQKEKSLLVVKNFVI